MCGIAGIINGNKNSKETLQKMMHSIKHRGPDDNGTFCDEHDGVYFGSQRLSINDLSPKGKMPMFNEDKSITVCQNGEIYNYHELKKALSAHGHKFISESDTEVIVHGYEEWGTNVFSKLQGMFAIAIYDIKNNIVILARDRIGIKPLYYVKYENSIYFSSEAKSFSSIKDFSFGNNIDYENVNLMLGFMFLPKSDETIVKGIKKLEPGHFIKIDLKKNSSGDISIHKYWDIEDSSNKLISKDLSFEDAVNELDELLQKTVSSHLMSDVPLGVMLSGGLDSSLITALVKKLSKSETLTFTAKFAHKLNESKNAKNIASYLKTNHREILIDTKDISANIEKHIRNYDDLATFDGGLITTKILSDEIKKLGVTVLLLGEGADEIFGGYSWFGISQLPYSFLPDIFKSAIYYYAISRNVTFNPQTYYSYWNKMFKSMHNSDTFRNVSNMELNTQLPNHLLMKVDKATMAASIEARVPFLDHKVVEFAYNLPREYKLKGNMYNFNSSNEKYILRKVAERYLPQEAVWRKKRGFMLPMGQVLDSDISKVKDYMFAKDSISSKLLSKKQVENLFIKSPIGIMKMQKEYLIWRLFLLEVWKKKYAR